MAISPVQKSIGEANWLRSNKRREAAGREKRGFSVPDANWFKGESIEYVKRRVMTLRAKIHDYLDFDVVKTLVGDHLEGWQNRRLLIWSLLNLEQYCEAYA